MKATKTATPKAELKFDAESNCHLYVFYNLRFVRGKKSWVSVESWNDASSFRLQQKIEEIGAIVPCQAGAMWRGHRGIEIPAKTAKKIFA